MKRRILFSLILLIALSACQSGRLVNERPTRSAQSFLEKQGSQIISLQFREKKFWKKGQVNGQDIEWMIDTGSTYTLIPRKQRELYSLSPSDTKGKPTQLVTMSGNTIESVKGVQAETLTVGRIGISHFPVKLFGIDGIRSLMIEDGIGIIGGDWFLKKNTILLCGGAKLASTPQSFANQSWKTHLTNLGYHSIPLATDVGYHLFSVPISLGSQTLSALVDTGAPHTILPKSFAAHSQDAQIKETDIIFDGSGSARRSEKTILSDLKVGPHPAGTLQCNVIDFTQMTEKQRKQFPDGYSSVILGLDFLIQHQAIIDYRNQVLYLIPR